jgi:hypothetical protein
MRDLTEGCPTGFTREGTDRSGRLDEEIGSEAVSSISEEWRMV